MSRVAVIQNAATLIAVYFFVGGGAWATELVKPVFFSSPDYGYGRRQPVTAADGALIQSYRSKKPAVSTSFSSSDELQNNWTLIVDDTAGLKSCRRAQNVATSNDGLIFKTLLTNDCKAKWSTGSITSRATYTYGFFEIQMKIADIRGMNNAFWMTTSDHYEIDVGEVQYPNYSHLGLQVWPVDKRQKHSGVGFGAVFKDNLYEGFHDYGLLWLPKELIFEVDGEPIAALNTGGSVSGAAHIWLSNALADWASGPVPAHPEGHGMSIRSFRYVPLN